jgi:hypothetical protein
MFYELMALLIFVFLAAQHFEKKLAHMEELLRSIRHKLGGDDD